MSENNNLSARVDIDTAAAKRAINSLAKAMRTLATVSEAGNTSITAAQKRSTKTATDSGAAIVAANKSVVKSDAARSVATVKSIRIENEARLKGINDRRGARDIIAAKTGVITSNGVKSGDLITARTDEVNKRTGENSLANAARTQLLTNKATTEELRQQVILRAMNKKAQDAVNRSQRDGAVGLSGMRYALYDVSNSFRIAGAAGVAMGIGVAGVAIKWETAFAGIIRTTDESTTKSAAKVAFLRSQFVDLAQTIPVSFDELAKIGTLAGQLGIGANNVTEFTRTVAMFSATTDVSTEQAATAFGRLNSLIPDVRNNFNGLAESVLKVGVNSVATETQILKVATQISSITGAANFGYEATIGLSGALASIAVPPELSRGVMTRVFGTISRAITTGGTDLEKFGNLTGQTAEQFKTAWSDDAAGQFERIMNGVREQGGSAEAVLRSLGITSVRDVPVIMRLANAADSLGVAGGLIAENMKNAGDAAGELERQYAIISGTTGAKLQVLLNNVMALLDEIGSTQLGFLGDQIDNITKSVRSFTDSLDEPARLFGGWELPWTNGDVFGITIAIAAFAGVLGLVIAGLGQVAAGGIAISQVLTTVRGSMAAHATVTSAAAVSNAAFAVSSNGVVTATTLASASTGKFAGALRGLLRFGGPIAAVFAAFALADLYNDLGKATTGMEELSNSFMRTDKSAGDAFLTIEGWNASGSLLMGTGALFDNLDQLRGALGKIQDDGMWNDTFARINPSTAGDYTRLTGAADVLDDSLTNLVGAGKSEKAFELFGALAKEAKLSDTAIMSLLDRTDGFKSAMRDTLSGLGVEDTDANFVKLARGTLPEYNNAMEKALDVTEGTAEAFEGGGDAVSVFMDKINSKLTEFTDFGSVYQDTLDSVNAKGKEAWVKEGKAVEEYVDVATATLDDFLGTMEKSMADQRAFAGNLAKVLLEAGPEVAEAAADLSPTLLAELVKGIDEGSPALMERFKVIVADGGVGAVAGMSAAIASIAAPQVEAAFAAMGDESAALWIEAIMLGTATTEELLAIFRANESAKKIDPALAPPYTGSVAYQLQQFRLDESRKSITIPIQYKPAIFKPGYVDPMGVWKQPFTGGQMFSGGKAFAGGGYTGDGGMYKPAGIVHKGEFVFTKESVDGLGTSYLYNLMRAGSKGYAGGGSVNNSSNSYVPSFGGGSSRGGNNNTTIQVVEFSARSLAAIERMGNPTINLDGRALTNNNNAASLVATKRGKN
jgi:TP901 family phage tail tape measure protein